MKFDPVGHTVVLGLGGLLLALGLSACFAWGLRDATSGEASSGSSLPGESLASSTSPTDPGESLSSSTSPTEDALSTTGSSSTSDPGSSDLCYCAEEFLWSSNPAKPFGATVDGGSYSVDLDVDGCCGAAKDLEVSVQIEQYWVGYLTIALTRPGSGETVLLMDPAANPMASANLSPTAALRFRGADPALPDRKDLEACWPGDADVICGDPCHEGDVVECVFRPAAGDFSKLLALGANGRWTLVVDSSDENAFARLFSVSLKLIH